MSCGNLAVFTNLSIIILTPGKDPSLLALILTDSGRSWLILADFLDSLTSLLLPCKYSLIATISLSKCNCFYVTKARTVYIIILVYTALLFWCVLVALPFRVSPEESKVSLSCCSDLTEIN